MLHVEPRGAVPESEIVDAERRIGATFPEPFRTWLRDTGGGMIPMIEMPHEGGDGVLQQLDGPTMIADSYGRGFRELIPREYVALSADGGGALAIRIAEPGVGKVYWADYDRSQQLYDDGVIEEDEATEEIMTELAPDWNAFLASR